MVSASQISKIVVAITVATAISSAIWNIGFKEQSVPAAETSGSGPKSSSTPGINASTANAAKTNPAEDNLREGRKYLQEGNFDKARAALEAALKAGSGAAACHLGEMTLNGQGGLQKDHEKAASFFQVAQSQNIICFASN